MNKIEAVAIAWRAALHDRTAAESTVRNCMCSVDLEHERCAQCRAADRACDAYRDAENTLIQAVYVHAFEVGVVGEQAGLDVRGSRTETIEARFVPVIEQMDGTFEVASQDIFHDLAPLGPGEVAKLKAPEGVELSPVDPERTRKAAAWVRLTVQHPVVKEQQRKRGSDAGIRREYLERAFDARIHRMRQTEWEYQARVGEGEQGSESRLSKHQDEIQQIELRKAERLRAIDRLRVARAGDVRHLATALVLPLPADSDAHQLMKYDPEVEAAAMEQVMQFERARGWHPEDVHDKKDGRGYDILSTGPKDAETGLSPVRRIEVKGRGVPTGDVALTRNEWIKAGRLGKDYWLYVVYEARPGNTGRLMMVQDPANALAGASQPLTVIKGYRLPAEAIARAAKGAK